MFCIKNYLNLTLYLEIPVFRFTRGNDLCGVSKIVYTNIGTPIKLK
jgi:hypothetical protein